MLNKHAEWANAATNQCFQLSSSKPEHKSAKAMSRYYQSLANLAVPYEPFLNYDVKYKDLMKAQTALTAANVKSLLSIEDLGQLTIDKSDVVFTLFAYMGTHVGMPSMVDFGPCRKASMAFFDDYLGPGSRPSQVSHCHHVVHEAQTSRADHKDLQVYNLKH